MIYCLIITVLVTALDQLTKYLSVAYLSGTDTVPVINGVINLTYVENRGAAFGMLSEHRWVFMSLSIVILAAVMLYLIMARPKSLIVKTCIAFILGGGIGNMIDRIWRGFVVDFIDVKFIDFYIFNIADSFVCVGCIALIIYLIADEIKNSRSKRSETTG